MYLCTNNTAHPAFKRKQFNLEGNIFPLILLLPRYETTRGRQLVNRASPVPGTRYTIHHHHHHHQLAWISRSNYLTDGMFIQSVRGDEGEEGEERGVIIIVITTRYNYSKLHYCTQSTPDLPRINLPLFYFIYC